MLPQNKFRVTSDYDILKISKNKKPVCVRDCSENPFYEGRAKRLKRKTRPEGERPETDKNIPKMAENTLKIAVFQIKYLSCFCNTEPFL